MSETNTNPNTEGQQIPNQEPTNTQKQPEFDYDKLASLITGKQTVAEDTVLKSYFKQQGLSSEEMSQAIHAFKEQKAKNTPNVAELQNTISTERGARIKAEINQSATLEAIKQGVDVKSIPYVLKMVDFKNVIGNDGQINAEKLTEAIKTVLDDVPALKGTSANDSGNGIHQIGGDGGDEKNLNEDVLRGIFGIKK